jgi:hypothetical protein
MNSKIAFVSAMLALAAMAADPQLAQAAPKSYSQQLCEDLGWEWNDQRGKCEGCTMGDGKRVKPSTSGFCPTPTNPAPTKANCYCDGLTGEWKPYAVISPSQQPPPTGLITTPPRGDISPTLRTTPPGPGAPLPLRKAPGQ